jgi:hypothetical protein
MALLSRYLNSTKHLSAIFDKIVDGAVPEKFNRDHLEAIGLALIKWRAISGLSDGCERDVLERDWAFVA